MMIVFKNIWAILLLACLFYAFNGHSMHVLPTICIGISAYLYFVKNIVNFSMFL